MISDDFSQPPSKKTQKDWDQSFTIVFIMKYGSTIAGSGDLFFFDFFVLLKKSAILHHVLYQLETTVQQKVSAGIFHAVWLAGTIFSISGFHPINLSFYKISR